MGHDSGILSGETFETARKDPAKPGRRFSIHRTGQILQGEQDAGISPNAMAANIAALCERTSAATTSAVAKPTHG